MESTEKQCIQCKEAVNGNFCHNCGQNLVTKRLSLHSILHEAFHFFTHFDKGFPFTLKKLLTAPGKMQKGYIDGFRSKHQKPFSMFFLCGSFAALVMYWVSTLLTKHFDAGDVGEASFFHTYWVAFQVIMIPVYALVTFLVFRQSKLNYGEIMVFQLYLFSFLFIVVASIHLLKFIFPHLQTRYIELPVIIIYTLITNFSFFTNIKRWQLVILTVLSIGICFLLSSYLQDLIVDVFTKKAH